MTAQDKAELRELLTALKWAAAALLVGAGFLMPLWLV